MIILRSYCCYCYIRSVKNGYQILTKRDFKLVYRYDINSTETTSWAERGHQAESCREILPSLRVLVSNYCGLLARGVMSLTNKSEGSENMMSLKMCQPTCIAHALTGGVTRDVPLGNPVIFTLRKCFTTRLEDRTISYLTNDWATCVTALHLAIILFFFPPT